MQFDYTAMIRRSEPNIVKGEFKVERLIVVFEFRRWNDRILGLSSWDSSFTIDSKVAVWAAYAVRLHRHDTPVGTK